MLLMPGRYVQHELSALIWHISNFKKFYIQSTPQGGHFSKVDIIGGLVPAEFHLFVCN